MRLLPRRQDTEPQPAAARRLAALEAIADDPLAAADVLRVDTRIGPVLVHADDEVMTPWIRHHREWEAEEAAWLEGALRPGATMLDVGANIGYFSVLAARAVGPAGRVIAIEPERRNLRVLRLNTWAHDQVTIVPVAAWHSRTALELRFNASNAGDHQVHEASEGAAGTLVPAIALDDLLDETAIDVIKIDTQGVDHHVITGLSRTLAANPQAQLLVEFWLESMDERGDRGADVLAGYRKLGRPIGLLGDHGNSTLATDAEILAATEVAHGRFVNLVIGPAG